MAQFMALVRRDYERFSQSAFTRELLDAEAEAARALYAQGVFRAVWGRMDSPGAVILMEAESLDAALAAFEALPLKEKQMLLVDQVVPLTPYRAFCPQG